MAMQLLICEKMHVSLLVLSSHHLKLWEEIQGSVLKTTPLAKSKGIDFKTQITYSIHVLQESHVNSKALTRAS